MISFDPKVEVRLIKAGTRTAVVEGLPVSTDRYGNLTGIDLTPFLGEGGGVQIAKSVREEAGAFSLTMIDRPYNGRQWMESLYGLIEPMDMVEIRMAHNPADYGYVRGSQNYGIPIIMRGFVSNVVRNEVMAGGIPQRTLTVAGQDFGKILSLIQIIYLNNSAVGDNILTAFAFFHKYSEYGGSKIKLASSFVGEVLESVINPYLEKIAKLTSGSLMNVAVPSKLSSNVTVEGSVSPYAVNSMADCSLHAFLSQLLDVGVFNEMYVQDDPTEVKLIVRPTPFQAAGSSQDAFIQNGAWAESIDINAVDIVAQNVTRSDRGVANYFWVSNERAVLAANVTAKQIATSGNSQNYIMFDHPNSAASLYGVRKMEVGSLLLPDSFSSSESMTSEQQPEQTSTLTAWIDQRRAYLAQMNRDNVVFESGSLRLRGNENIKAGTYLNVRRGSAMMRVYAHKVIHDFQPYQGFFTTVMFDRGTGWMTRAQAAGSPYLSELTLNGVR